MKSSVWLNFLGISPKEFTEEELEEIRAEAEALDMDEPIEFEVGGYILTMCWVDSYLEDGTEVREVEVFEEE